MDIREQKRGRQLKKASPAEAQDLAIVLSALRTSCRYLRLDLNSQNSQSNAFAFKSSLPLGLLK